MVAAGAFDGAAALMVADTGNGAGADTDGGCSSTRCRFASRPPVEDAARAAG